MPPDKTGISCVDKNAYGVFIAMQESESGFCVKAARTPVDCSTSTGLGVSLERSPQGAIFSRDYWSSSENSETKFPHNNNAWNQRFSDGNQNNNNKNNENSVRAVRDFTQRHCVPASIAGVGALF
jgi:hypothetical protein